MSFLVGKVTSVQTVAPQVNLFTKLYAEPHLSFLPAVSQAKMHIGPYPNHSITKVEETAKIPTLIMPTNHVQAEPRGSACDGSQGPALL